MIIRGAYHVAGTPETIYQLVQDSAILSAAMPGCSELSPLGSGKFSIRMNVAIAALSGDFQGTVEAKDHEPPHRFRMIVEATGRLGFLKGEGLLTFQPGPERSVVVSYDGSATIGGTIASVGQRLLDATARMMIRRFFERLERAIAASNGRAPGSETQPVEAAADASSAPMQPSSGEG